MLRCIICRTKQANALDLCQRSILQKGLIKYGKINGITPMRSHVESMHLKLVTHRKLTIIKELVIAASHSQQFGKKWFGPSKCVITPYFGVTSPYKKSDEAQQQFLEDLVLYTCKGYKPLSTCDNIWLKRLVLRLCSRVVFPSQTTFVKKMLPTMVKKSMQLHVFPRFA
jgi:hypothetical protein